MAEQIVKFYLYEICIASDDVSIRSKELYGNFNHIEEGDNGPTIDLYSIEKGVQIYDFCDFNLNNLGHVIGCGGDTITYVTTSPNELDAWSAFSRYLDNESFRLNIRALKFKQASEKIHKAMKTLAQEDDKNGLN